MLDLPETKLKTVIIPGKNTPRFFLKYESDLPFGGGNKVRRFLCWLDENKDAKEIHIASDVGSHSFLVLSQILQDLRYKHLVATFWERENSNFSPYRTQIRKNYLNNNKIRIQSYHFLFFYKWLLNYVSRNKTVLFTLGGSVFLKNNAYQKTLSECISQLKQFEITHQRIWHLLPIASGTMSDAFLAFFEENKLYNHKIIGLLTGDKLLRPYLILKYFFNKHIHLLETQSISWEKYIGLTHHFYEQNEILLDPIHTSHLALFLQKIPKWINQEDVVVVWLTQPYISTLPEV